MLFEKYKDEEKAIELEGSGAGKNEQDDVSKFSRVQSKDDMQDTRPISLYFVDEHDARALADEMKQMKHMKGGDLRITCTSLGKAVRQASHLGNGLPTGQPVDDTTGKMPSMDDGGSLRHKIVPSKRELFYAARCAGRERVGCFGDTAQEDADLLLQPQDVIEANKMGARRKATKNIAARAKKARQLEKEGLVESDVDRLRREYAHREGQVGLPVFYSGGLVKRPPALRRMVQGSKAWESSSLIPLYFSYEDLLNDWSEMRNRSANQAKIPESPPEVESAEAAEEPEEAKETGKKKKAAAKKASKDETPEPEAGEAAASEEEDSKAKKAVGKKSTGKAKSKSKAAAKKEEAETTEEAEAETPGDGEDAT